MQQDIINIDLNLPTQWEDLTDKQLRYVFALLSQGFTATEVKADAESNDNFFSPSKEKPFFYLDWLINRDFCIHLQYEKDVFTCYNGVNHHTIV